MVGAKEREIRRDARLKIREFVLSRGHVSGMISIDTSQPVVRLENEDPWRRSFESSPRSRDICGLLAM